MRDIPTFFHQFKRDVSGIVQPDKFTFPFCYTPHPLSILAAEELQHYLEHQTDFQHNFGLTAHEGQPIGKMFGVLVVETEDGQLGYLAATSGKLAGTNQHRYFVPPIFDMLTKDSFFLQEENTINALNRQIEELQQQDHISSLQKKLQQQQTLADRELKAQRVAMKAAKAVRRAKRESAKPTYSPSAYAALEEDLIKQSYRDQHEYAVRKDYWKKQRAAIQEAVDKEIEKIDDLKRLRKRKSSMLQQQLFQQYQFLNAQGERRSVLDIFAETAQILPPAGAGECAAPKLLQYAYEHQLKPITLAEFWWGASPHSEVRKHKLFYPACKSKCEPILSHMLQGLAVEPNPLLTNPAVDKKFDIIFEDQDIIVLDKPAEFLSVPGIHIKDSVYTRICASYPDISGPVIIHRLDMSTSGILVLAKNKDAHKYIQDQFIRHTVEKRYTALLEGVVAHDEGLIDLPLRVDLEDRPRQVVCYPYGKPAQTKYRVIERKNGKTKIHFFPLTGRTHQLRMHAAHHKGLNCPIVGDDLYGQRSNRLHLHAGYISFTHPTSKEKISFTLPDPF